MKSVLITGASGFIGKSVANFLADKGHFVVGLVTNKIENEKITFEQAILDKEINPEFLKNLNYKFDAIYHCAGGGSVTFSENNFLYDFFRSVSATTYILEYMLQYQREARLIYMSSPSVVTPTNKRIKEDDDIAPTTKYGLIKSLSEKLCNFYCQNYSLDIKILRLFSVYGPGLRKQIIWDSFNRLIYDKAPEFWGSGDEVRDFIHINDVLNIFEKCLIERKLPDIVNVGSGEGIKINNVVNEISNAINNNKLYKFNGKISNGSISSLIADTELMENTFGKDLIKFQDGLYDTLKWIKDEKI